MRVKKAIIKAYYGLDGEYIPFDSNPLHGKVFENVDVQFKEMVRTICGIDFAVDVVKISGQEPIDCELIDAYEDSDKTLIIKICQDWG